MASSSSPEAPFTIPQRPRKLSSPTSSSTPTPTAILSAAPTPAPSRNPSLFPGSDASPSNNNNDHDRAPRAPAPDPFASAEYMSALAAAAQASLQSAPSSPGADLPIARSSSGSGGAGNRQSASYFQSPPPPLPQKDEGDEEPRFSTTSFLDVDSSDHATTPGSATTGGQHDDGVPPDELVGGPVSRGEGEDEDEDEDGQGQHRGAGFVDPLARARAGVSVAKGEGLVEQVKPMLGGSGGAAAAGVRGHGRQQSWSEQDMKHDMTARFWNGGGPVQGYESTSNGA